MREALERAKDKEARDKELKEGEERAVREAKEKAAAAAKEKAAAAAARESKGVSAVFGHLYNTSRSLSKNATEAVPAALSKVWAQAAPDVWRDGRAAGAAPLLPGR